MDINFIWEHLPEMIRFPDGLAEGSPLMLSITRFAGHIAGGSGPIDRP
jgi:hypothetical protein